MSGIICSISERIFCRKSSKLFVRYQFFSFVYYLRRIYQKEKKKARLSFKNIGEHVIVQKAMTSFKQVARHMMAFFEIKSTCQSDFPKNMNFVSNFMFTLYKGCNYDTLKWKRSYTSSERRELTKDRN
jgi:hypothetical protein